MAGYTAKEAA